MLSKQPKAILISDIHFTPQTLEIASEAFLMAQNKAIELNVPLIICGDTLDTKDIMRAQCVNRIIELVGLTSELDHYFLVGNHDMLNEKGQGNSLKFLGLLSNATLIDTVSDFAGGTFIPYQSSTEAFTSHVKSNRGLIICHQGVQGANMGHYVQDKTSISQDEVAGKRIISGHYHKRQDIPLKNGGAWSYVGNPYTLSFGEAEDPPKGFQVLLEDGSLEFVPTKLRKHIVLEFECKNLDFNQGTPLFSGLSPKDLVWLKVSGSYLELEALDKKALGEKLFGHSNFRFDKIPTEVEQLEVTTEPFSKMDLLNQVIDNTDESLENKQALKALAQELINEN